MLDSTKMKHLTVFLLTIYSVSSDSNKCFTERKKICWDTFENAVVYSVFYSSTGLDKCSVLRHFVICARQAAGDCFENERDEYVDELLEVWESKSNEFCEVDIPDDKFVPSNKRPIDADPDCAVTGWSQWSPCSVTCGNGYKVRTRNYVMIPSLMNLDVCNARGIEMKQENLCSVDCTVNFTQPESVTPDSKKCLIEREKICWNTFENAASYRKNYSNVGLDKCSVLRHFIFCSRQAAQDCFENEYDEDVDEVIGVWERKTEWFCKEDIRDDKIFPVNKRLADADRNCGVTEWSEWSPCSVTCGNGRKVRRRRYSNILTLMNLDKCNTRRTIDMKQENPCSVDCTIYFKQSEIPSYHLADRSKTCISERTVYCITKFLNREFEECSKSRESFAEDCSQEAVARCFGEEINARYNLYKYLKTFFEELCKSYDYGNSPYGSVDVSKVQNVAIMNTTELSSVFRDHHAIIDDIEFPIFKRVSTEETGAWFQETSLTNLKENGKYYSTYASDPNHLYEYNSEFAFHTSNKTKIYELPFPFSGTGHLVYNGAFYYHEAKSQMIVRFDFEHSTSYATRIVDASYNDEHYLYSSELGYMDVMADIKGLYVVYSAKDTDNTLIRKLHPDTLATEHLWNLTLPHRKVGEMFIADNVLYAVDSVTAPVTRIRFAFDLYENKVLPINVQFFNFFRSTTTISYNLNNRQLYAWDKGNQLLYPITFRLVLPEGRKDPK